MFKMLLLAIYSWTLSMMLLFSRLPLQSRMLLILQGFGGFKKYFEKLGKKLKRNPVMVGVDGHSLSPVQICAGLEKRVKIQQSVRNLTVFKLRQLLLQLGLC